MPIEPRDRAPTDDPPYKVYRPSGGPDGSSSEERPYTLYRSLPRGLRSRLRGEEESAELDGERIGAALRRRFGARRRPGGGGRGDGDGVPWWRRRVTPRRVLKWLAVAIVAWLLLSVVLFLVSAQIQSGTIPQSAQNALHSGGNMVTGTDTVLVLGTDQRPKGTHEAGANTSDAGSRSDSIMLWRIGGGTSRRLSIPRDTVANIPGHGQDKINAAYAYGGPALTIKTVEGFTGIKINHLIIVNLANFPKFIDAIGGVDVTTGADLLEHQRRGEERRLHAEPAAGRPPPHGRPGADAGPDPRERLQRRQQRPHPRGLSAEDPQRDQVEAAVAGHLLPPSVGLVGCSQGGPHRYGRLHPAEPVRGLRDRRLGADGRVEAERARRRCPTAAPRSWRPPARSAGRSTS